MEENNYPGSSYQNLFDYLSKEHGLTLLESEMNDLINVVHKFHPAGAAWVKASDCDMSKGGMLFYRFDGPTLKSIGIGHFVGDMFYGTHLDVFQKLDWEYLYILDESPTPAADWAKYYDTLYYIVMPVLNKLRHRTDNDTRMMEKGSDIRDTIHKALADIKKLPSPISSNEPPFLVQSDATPAAAREEDAVSKKVIDRIKDFNLSDVDAPVFTHTKEFRAHFSYIKGKLMDIINKQQKEVKP